MFGWFRARRRRRWLAEPFPTAWNEALRRHVKQSERLPAELHENWRQRIQVFVRETSWEGCRDFEVCDEVRVVIAAYATLLTLGFEDEWLTHVRHVLVHPTPYQGQRASIGVNGVDYSQGDWMQQLEDAAEDEHLGEAWLESGTIILAWSEVPTAEHLVPLGTNVVLHEFGHAFLERLGNWFQTAWTERDEPWLAAFQAEFDRQVRESDRGRRSLLDDYAAESPDEFFCVAIECFFERPMRMQSQSPTLFSLLKQCVRLDPSTWTTTSE